MLNHSSNSPLAMLLTNIHYKKFNDAPDTGWTQKRIFCFPLFMILIFLIGRKATEN